MVGLGIAYILCILLGVGFFVIGLFYARMHAIQKDDDWRFKRFGNWFIALAGIWICCISSYEYSKSKDRFENKQEIAKPDMEQEHTPDTLIIKIVKE